MARQATTKPIGKELEPELLGVMQEVLLQSLHEIAISLSYTQNGSSMYKYFLLACVCYPLYSSA